MIIEVILLFYVLYIIKCLLNRYVILKRPTRLLKQFIAIVITQSIFIQTLKIIHIPNEDCKMFVT